MSETSRGLRIRQGLLLLVGALALDLLVAGGTLDFFWTPLIIGVTYLAAASSGGRAGSYWATACVLTGWGLAVVFIGEVKPTDIDTSGAYLFGAGIGSVVGLMLMQARFAVSAMGLAATVAAAGLLLALSAAFPDVLEDARTYAALIGLVGLVNVVLGVMPEREGRGA